MRRTFPDEIPGCTRTDILDGSGLETDKAVATRCGRSDGRVDQAARTFASEVFGEPLTFGIPTQATGSSIQVAMITT